MLGKPLHGWSSLILEENKYELSYLTDVSLEWLDSAIDGLKNLKPFAVRGFLEPKRIICVISYWNNSHFLRRRR